MKSIKLVSTITSCVSTSTFASLDYASVLITIFAVRKKPVHSLQE